MERRETYREQIMTNVDYDYLVGYTAVDRERLDELVGLMLDTVCSTKPTLRVAGEELPAEVVRSRLLDAAQARGDIRLLILLETLCATGIRVSELQYITVEAAHSGVAEIALKGKIRTILLPTELCRKLLKYAKKCGVAHGQIFLTKKGNGLSRKFIWAEMKKLCEAAKVARSKVFPHNPCGGCSPGRSTPPAGTWCVWRMCWDTAVSRRPASTCCPRQKKVPASWTGLACSAGGHNYYFVQLVENREMKTPHSKGCEAQMDITGKADSKHNESALHNCVK